MFFPLRDRNPTTRTAVVTYSLVIANVLAFLWLWRMPDHRQQLVVIQRGFIPARIAQLTNPRPLTIEVEQVGAMTPHGPIVHTQSYPLAPDRGSIFLSLFTCMFLHGGWMHLIGNMWFLWIFGNNVEDRLGSPLFLLFYLAGGLFATAVQWWADPASTVPVIGASGAVAGVLGAYAITWPWAKVSTFVVLIIFFTVVDLPALVVLGIWFLLQLLEAGRTLGSMDVAYRSGVAFWAHVGGFAFGAVLMPVLGSLVPPPRPRLYEAALPEIID